jgi:hypothetical protein
MRSRNASGIDFDESTLQGPRESRYDLIAHVKEIGAVRNGAPPSLRKFSEGARVSVLPVAA